MWLCCHKTRFLTLGANLPEDQNPGTMQKTENLDNWPKRHLYTLIPRNTKFDLGSTKLHFGEHLEPGEKGKISKGAGSWGAPLEAQYWFFWQSWSQMSDRIK